MKNNTYSRRSEMVSTVKKSPATDPGGLLTQERTAKSWCATGDGVESHDGGG